jgi:hypothetical protein
MQLPRDSPEAVRNITHTDTHLVPVTRDDPSVLNFKFDTLHPDVAFLLQWTTVNYNESSYSGLQ